MGFVVVPLRKMMSLESFLDWEERQELRHEFDGFQAVAMTGGMLAHATIQSNLAIAVGGRRSAVGCGGRRAVSSAATSRS